MTMALSFQSTTFDIIDHDGQPWLKASQIATALGYKDTRAVTKIYQAHEDEFLPSMSVVLKLTTTSGIPTETRIFSLRGCHLVAMFARTSVAKAFRVWVLDVLETLNKAQAPVLPPTITPSTPDDRIPLRALVNAWSQVCGQPHQALWPQVKAHFQLSRIDDLPVEWIPDALAFVQSKIDALPKVLPETSILALPRAKPNPLFDFAQAQYINKSLSNKACQLTMDIEKQLNEWISEAGRSFNHSRRTQEIATLEDFVFDEHVQVLKRLSHAVFSNLMAFSVQCSSMAFMAQLLERKA